MPMWVQVTLTTAALIGAIGVIWAKALRPLLRLYVLSERMVPLLTELIDVFGGSTGALSVLHDMSVQFRTNGGSSLRDVVDTLESLAKANEATSEALSHAVAQLEKAATENHSAIGVLKVNLGAIQLLDKEQREEQREQLARLTILLDRVTVKVDALTGTGRRIEAAAAVVADDLADSHRRADDVGAAPHGAAADAAAASAPDKKEDS